MNPKPLKIPIPPGFEHEHGKRSILVSDLAQWFNRTRPTIETWMKSKRLPPPSNPPSNPERTRTHLRRIYWTLERLRAWNSTIDQQERIT